MANNEKYCLRWNDFESNISTAFRELRDEKDFFDVTLACDDNQVGAHKVILSACSPFFRTVLRRNPHQHPLLYLRGVKYTELVNVLDFMYQGEVNVAQEELNDFLSVAEDLRVKGLTQGNKQNGPKLPKSEPRPSPKDPHIDTGPPPKRKRPSPSPQPPPPRLSEPQSFHEQEDDDIQEVVPVKTEPMTITPTVVDDPIQTSSGQEMALEGHATYEEGYDNYSYGDGDQSYDDSQMMDASMGDGTVEGNKVAGGRSADDLMEWIMMSDGKPGWQCGGCRRIYESKNKNTLHSHIEAKHRDLIDSPMYTCAHCFKNYNTYKTLLQHKRRVCNKLKEKMEQVEPRSPPQ